MISIIIYYSIGLKLESNHNEWQLKFHVLFLGHCYSDLSSQDLLMLSRVLNFFNNIASNKKFITIITESLLFHVLEKTNLKNIVFLFC